MKQSRFLPHIRSFLLGGIVSCTVLVLIAQVYITTSIDLPESASGLIKLAMDSLPTPNSTIKTLQRIDSDLSLLQTQQTKTADDLTATVREMAIQVNYGNKGLSNAVAELKGLMLAKPQPFLSEKPAETGVKERLSIERSITGLVEEIKGLRAAVKGQRNDQSYRKRSAQPQQNVVRQNRRLPLRPSYIAPHDPSHWQQHSFQPYGTHAFVLFSSYQVSTDRFVSLGLAALRLEKEILLSGCHWHGRGGGEVIPGNLTLFFMDEHHFKKYDTVRLECHLASETGGGTGWLIGDIDFEGVLLYREDNDAVNLTPTLPWKSLLTYCSGPLHGALASRRVWEWFEYHRVVAGMDYAILYNVGAVDEEVRGALGDYYRSGRVEEVDFRDAQSYNVWYFCQLLSISDCVYRTRLTSRWVMMGDLDEYLLPIPPHTVPSLLRQYSLAPWISHGQIVFGSQICNAQKGGEVFEIERATFRWPGNYCADLDTYPDANYCLKDMGHRKCFVNPRKVKGAQVHYVKYPPEGMDLSLTLELAHAHFSGLTTLHGTTLNQSHCEEIVGEGERKEWWVEDHRLASAVEGVKKCAFGDAKCIAQIDPQ